MPEDYDPDDYLTPSQVARLMKVTPRAVRYWIQQGQIKALRRPGGRYLIHRDDARMEPTRGPVDRPT